MKRRGAKWSDVPPGAIASSVADMEFDSPKVAVDAAVTEARRGGGYAAPDAEQALIRAAANWWRRHGLVMARERTTPVGSIAATMATAIARVSDPGDAVVRVRPTYPPLVAAVEVLGREDRPVDLVRGGPGWELDLELLDAACDGARLLLWVAPHNPTGRVFTRDETTAVAEIAARHDLVVLSDEIWADVLLGAAHHVPFEAAARDVDERLARRTVTMLGTSKAWNLADLGAALVHCDDDEVWARLHGPGQVPLLPRASRPGVAASLAAWRDGEKWLRKTLAVIESNVDHAVATLGAALGEERVTRPQGTYLCWVDLRGLVPGDDPMRVLAVADGVVPTDGVSYGAKGFIRLNLATTPEEAGEVVGRVVALLGAQS